jgi:hypothetical protein
MPLRLGLAMLWALCSTKSVVELVGIYYRLLVNLDSIAEFCEKKYTTSGSQKMRNYLNWIDYIDYILTQRNYLRNCRRGVDHFHNFNFAPR